MIGTAAPATCLATLDHSPTRAGSKGNEVVLVEHDYQSAPGSPRMAPRIAAQRGQGVGWIGAKACTSGTWGLECP
jgi:hypothetical protein